MKYSNKRKICISTRSQRKLVHELFISKKMFMKGRIYIYEILQKIKYLPNNILGVSREIILSKCNEYDFLYEEIFTE